MFNHKGGMDAANMVFLFVMHQYFGDANRFAPVYLCWLAANQKNL
jgi:hypothetical protein